MMRFKLFFISLLLSSNILASDITIAVAANVSYAISDLIKEFNTKNPDIKVNLTLASSGKLATQIKNGAPYDLFMSANMLYPNSLYKDKIALTKPIIYAEGTLALLSIKERDFTKGLNTLKEKDIKKIAIANPKTAPYGIAAKEALINSKLYENLTQKFIYGESISQTLLYTTRAADIGIVAKSLLYSSNMSKYKNMTNWIEIDPKLYTPTKQGVVMIKEKDEVKKFYDFLQSNEAKKIFKDFGYLVK